MVAAAAVAAVADLVQWSFAVSTELLARRSVFLSSVCSLLARSASKSPGSVASNFDFAVAVAAVAAAAVEAVAAGTVALANRNPNLVADILDSAAGSPDFVDSTVAVDTPDSAVGSPVEAVVAAYGDREPAYLPARYYHD